jgi:hypothetical protein
LLTDAKGIPLSIAVDGANRHDMKMSRETLKISKPKDPSQQRKRNKGYVLIKVMITMKFENW